MIKKNKSIVLLTLFLLFHMKPTYAIDFPWGWLSSSNVFSSVAFPYALCIGFLSAVKLASNFLPTIDIVEKQKKQDAQDRRESFENSIDFTLQHNTYTLEKAQEIDQEKEIYIHAGEKEMQATRLDCRNQIEEHGKSQALHTQMLYNGFEEGAQTVIRQFRKNNKKAQRMYTRELHESRDTRDKQLKQESENLILFQNETNETVASIENQLETSKLSEKKHHQTYQKILNSFQVRLHQLDRILGNMNESHSLNEQKTKQQQKEFEQIKMKALEINQSTFRVIEKFKKQKSRIKSTSIQIEPSFLKSIENKKENSHLSFNTKLTSNSTVLRINN